MDSKSTPAHHMDPAKALVMIKERDEKISELEKENSDIKKENSELRAKLAMYESPNMPTSISSLYNMAGKKFREQRGKDPGTGSGRRRMQWRLMVVLFLLYRLFQHVKTPDKLLIERYSIVFADSADLFPQDVFGVQHLQ